MLRKSPGTKARPLQSQKQDEMSQIKLLLKRQSPAAAGLCCSASKAGRSQKFPLVIYGDNQRNCFGSAAGAGSGGYADDVSGGRRNWRSRSAGTSTTADSERDQCQDCNQSERALQVFAATERQQEAGEGHGGNYAPQVGQQHSVR